MSPARRAARTSILAVAVCSVDFATAGLDPEAARADDEVAARGKPLAPWRTPAFDPGTEELEADYEARDAHVDGWAFEELRLFFGVFIQDGQGYQSQALPMIDGKGSESAWIIEPLASFRFRTNSKLDHTIVFPVDIVSAASPDATDLTATASAMNQSLALDISSTFKTGPVVDLSFHWGPHFEEPYRSFMAGPGLRFHLFEDNTIFDVNGTIVADAFDPIQPDGHDAGQAARITLTGNASWSQVLSPTTVLDTTVALTTQSGTLATTYNSILAHKVDAIGFDQPRRFAEIFPDNRFRWAALARVSQLVPATHTTLKASYRYYHDENEVTAHTGELELDQYIVPWLYLKAHGRLYFQNQISFWRPEFTMYPENDLPRTNDSDLATFISREAGLRVVFLRDRAPKAVRGPDSFDIGYLRYQRTDDLHVDFASLGYARTFE
jgi:hypothetical protein